ncbi:MULTISPECIES: hypothetical protein [Streptomyces]|uniref:hypothetical protein n=1 Tax=Streptomyces TaxID=1883 RepID=UPI001C310C55|nr:hypothetical protein [Streptomyces sp. GbtcB7]
MLDTGVTPRLGLAEAVDGLKAAGTARVYLAVIAGSQRRFTVLLAERGGITVAWARLGATPDGPVENVRISALTGMSAPPEGDSRES